MGRQQVLANKPKGVIFFDVDGTLTHGTSSGAYLGQFLGHAEAVQDMETRYAQGLVSNDEVCDVDAAGWKGRTEGEITTWLDGLPLVIGIEEVVGWCLENNFVPKLATLAWQPVGRYLCERFGFQGYDGPVLDVVDGKFSGVVKTYFDESAKSFSALEFAASIGVSANRCVAIGDSCSDLPLFSKVGYTIGFNAVDEVQAVANESFTGSDLRVILPSLAVWIKNRTYGG
ncbi:MAG TPA: haloacid dehalogenase-like hydrolase [Candidatus Nanopelagicaceae bacterium]|nr:haloacid dehalogenase-like hydrolase [Candidatus Nanopelagicaceae bacterium]